MTSTMAGLYLIGFAAPAFEQATCHVGETVDYVRNVPRAVYASAWMATLYFAVLPMIWLGVSSGRNHWNTICKIFWVPPSRLSSGREHGRQRSGS